MAEQKRLHFETSGAIEKYFDGSSALTAANRKQYHQVNRKGVPYCYDMTITFSESNGDGQLRQVLT